MPVDQSIIEAIDMWIKHGLNPGSCTRLLLEGNYAQAYQHAHPIIKPYWIDHVAYVMSIHERYRGDNMQKHKDSFGNNSI